MHFLQSPVSRMVSIWFIVTLSFGFFPQFVLLFLLPGYVLLQWAISISLGIGTETIITNPSIFFFVIFLGSVINFIIYFVIGHIIKKTSSPSPSESVE